jgi:hypothetical protein
MIEGENDNKQISKDKDTVIHKKTKFNIKIYWISWIVYLIILFLIKDFWKNRSEGDFGSLIWGCLFISFLSAVMIHLHENSKFMNYLKKNHLEKWTQLKTVFGYSGGNNGFKILGFIFSSDYLNDPTLKELKFNVRKSIFFLLTVFFSMPVILTLILLNFKH